MSKLKKMLARLLGKPGVRKALAGLTLATSSLAAAVVQAGGGGGHGGGHGGEPHINWWTWDPHAPPVGWFWVNFIVFAVVLVYFARNPIRNAFQQRYLSIKQAVEDAAAALAAARGRNDEYQGKLAGVEKEAAHQVERGRGEGALEREQIVAAASEYAERMRSDSQSVMEQEVEKAILRLRREQAREVLRLAEELLTSKLTEADRGRLVEEAITQLENGDSSPSEHRVRVASARPAPTAGGAA